MNQHATTLKEAFAVKYPKYRCELLSNWYIYVIKHSTRTARYCLTSVVICFQINSFAQQKKNIKT